MQDVLVAHLQRPHARLHVVLARGVRLDLVRYGPSTALHKVASHVGDAQFGEEPAAARVELLLHERDLLGRAQVHHATERVAVVKVGVGTKGAEAVRLLLAVHVAVRARTAVLETGTHVVTPFVKPVRTKTLSVLLRTIIKRFI